MNYRPFAFYFVCLVMFVPLGCSNWHILRLETAAQPIQFGPHLSSIGVDTLDIISGSYTHRSEKDTYSKSEHVQILQAGGDSLGGNLDAAFYRALENDPKHFIADGQVMVDVKRGISSSAIFGGIVGMIITGGRSEFGDFSAETINYHGVVYTIKKPNDDSNQQ